MRFKLWSQTVQVQTSCLLTPHLWLTCFPCLDSEEEYYSQKSASMLYTKTIFEHDQIPNVTLHRSQPQTLQILANYRFKMLPPRFSKLVKGLCWWLFLFTVAMT